MAVVAARAEAADTVVASPNAPTAIRTFAGWTAWQQLDLRRRRYFLRVRSPAGVVTDRPETEPVDNDLDDERRPDAIPFDLGPDAAGRPSLLVSVCGQRSCALRIARLPDAASRRIAGTGQPGPATAPTLWRNQVAWVDANRRVILRARPGSRRRSLDPWFGHRCATTRGPWRCGAPGVDGLELRGELLAGVVSFDLVDEGGDVTGVGLLNTTTGHGQAEPVVGIGEGGQTFLAPAFADAHTLSWMLTCLGDPAGCEGQGGIYRRDLRTDRVSFARDAQHDREGWAPWHGTTALLGPSRASCDPDGPAHLPSVRWCRIVRRRLHFIARA